MRFEDPVAFLRQVQCGVKMRHYNMGFAHTAARLASELEGDHLEAYWCRFCGWYHIGHPMDETMLRLRAKLMRSGTLPPPAPRVDAPPRKRKHSRAERLERRAEREARHRPNSAQLARLLYDDA